MSSKDVLLGILKKNNCRLDDDNVLTVINFLYPSPGPDAFFWAGIPKDVLDDEIILSLKK